MKKGRLPFSTDEKHHVFTYDMVLFYTKAGGFDVQKHAFNLVFERRVDE